MEEFEATNPLRGNGASRAAGTSRRRNVESPGVVQKARTDEEAGTRERTRGPAVAGFVRGALELDVLVRMPDEELRTRGVWPPQEASGPLDIGAFLRGLGGCLGGAEPVELRAWTIWLGQ